MFDTPDMAPKEAGWELLSQSPAGRWAGRSPRLTPDPRSESPVVHLTWRLLFSSVSQAQLLGGEGMSHVEGTLFSSVKFRIVQTPAQPRLFSFPRLLRSPDGNPISLRLGGQVSCGTTWMDVMIHSVHLVVCGAAFKTASCWFFLPATITQSQRVWGNKHFNALLERK